MSLGILPERGLALLEVRVGGDRDWNLGGRVLCTRAGPAGTPGKAGSVGRLSPPPLHSHFS